MSGSDTLLLGLVWYAIFLFSVTVHEAAHAWAAGRGGDATAAGQVTLDPLPHIRQEPFGTVVVPLISYWAGGWMIGWASTPFDPAWAERHPRRSALMALAGPAANLMLVLAAGAAIKAGQSAGVFFPPDRILPSQVAATNLPGMWVGAAEGVSVVFTLNLVLFAFNLIPVPPLDGSTIVTLALPARAAAWYRARIRHPAVAILGLLCAWALFGTVFSGIHRLAIHALYPGAYR